MVESETTPRGGMSRRELIRNSALAGAAAWTAPAIIDSLSSPAAADSVCGPGCGGLSYGIVVYEKGATYYVLKINAPNGTCEQAGQPPGNGAGCVSLMCDGALWTNPGAGGSAGIDRGGVEISIGNCADITIGNIGGFVQAADPSTTTIIFMYAHDGNVPDPLPNCDQVGCVACVVATCGTLCKGSKCKDGSIG